MTETKLPKLNGSDLFIGANGVYFTAPLPAFEDSPAFRAAAARFIAGVLLRGGQSVVDAARKASNDPHAALAKYVADWKFEASADKLPTVDSERADFAREALVKLCRAADPNASEATIDASVESYLPAYLKKHAEAIDAALRAKIAAGYTPKVKGKSGDSAAAPASVLKLDI